MDRAYGVRVATYSPAASAARVSAPTGAATVVGRLRQVDVAAVALPTPVPLRLGDAVDAVADPALVGLDALLARTAAALDTASVEVTGR